MRFAFHFKSYIIVIIKRISKINFFSSFLFVRVSERARAATLLCRARHRCECERSSLDFMRAIFDREITDYLIQTRERESEFHCVFVRLRAHHHQKLFHFIPYYERISNKNVPILNYTRIDQIRRFKSAPFTLSYSNGFHYCIFTVEHFCDIAIKCSYRSSHALILKLYQFARK